MNCCYKCRRRNALCHGKHPDGTWRCRDWGIEQDAKQQQAADAAIERETEMLMQDYRSESMARFIRKKKSGHLRG